MAIRTVVTRGYGNGTFSGTIALVTLRGYLAAEVPIFDADSRITTLAARGTCSIGAPDRTAGLGAPSRTFTPPDN